MNLKLPIYRFLLIGIMSLFVNGLFAQTDWAGQTWIGLHNLDYRNRLDAAERTELGPAGQTLSITETIKDYRLSAAAHLRRYRQDGAYRQYEVSFSDARNGTFTLVEDPNSPSVALPQGVENRITSLAVGFRAGRLVDIREKLTGDIGLGVLSGWSWVRAIPMTSATFPVQQSGLRTALNIHLGLNYQLHDRVHIAYAIVPITFDVFVYKQYVNNPILTESQKTSRGTNFDAITFPEVVGWGNFRVSYVLRD